MAVEGRHHLLSVILMTQDPKAISPKVRDNCDVAVIFNMKTYRNKESIWHDFINDVDKKIALALMDKHCVEHNALVCIQTNLNGDIKQNFFQSTGDKTKLFDEKYVLGGATQKAMILEERRKKKQKKAQKRAENLGIRLLKRQFDGDTPNFTVDNILK